MTRARGFDERVLVLAPTSKDAAVTRETLAGVGIDCLICKTIAEVCDEIDRGGGAAILTQEAILGDTDHCLARLLSRQPAWSDFPLVVLTPAGVDSPQAGRTLAATGHMTLVKRPVPLQVLVSTVEAALRDRRRQYTARADLAARERQAEALREADRRKDEFLAMLAHELRNPLAAISGATRVLSTSVVEPNDLAWGRGVLERQVRQLSRLIDDLLDVSRINSGKIRLRREVFDVEPVLRSAAEVVRPLLDDRRHELALIVEPGPIRLHADPARVEQILVNLITNAAKYTESGGNVSVSLGLEGAEVVFRVVDDGVGIPAEQLPRMFELFAQGDRSLDRSEGGLGIGLTLVRALAEMHGGTVSAISPGTGLGSEFIVRLPSAPIEIERPDARPDDANPSNISECARVLVVDDNADAARGLARILKRNGHDVRVAHDGLDAIEAARAFQPGVVLLDIGLPGMDGYAVASRLREDSDCRNALMIAVTGYGQDQDRRRAVESGFDHHLVKPIDYDRLMSILSGESKKVVDMD